MTEEELAKQAALDRIREIAAQSNINPNDLQAALTTTPAQPNNINLGHKLSLIELLYYIGGGIVVIGIGILVSQNWTSLSSFTKIAATLGSGALAFLIAVLLQHSAKTHSVSIAFHTIAALVLPIGLFVTFNLGGSDISSAGVQSLIFAILLAMYMGSFFLFGQTFFLLFSIIFGASLYTSLTNTFITTAPTLLNGNFSAYRDLVLGLALVFIGYSLRQGKHHSITGINYFFGVLTALSSVLTLGGFQPHQNIIWELIFPFLAFGCIVASVPLKSRSFMVWGTLFLMGYIFKITAEYFASSLGWPLALIVAGLAIIGAAAGAISIRRKYSKN